MFKKLMDAQKEHMNKHEEKVAEKNEKLTNSMTEKVWDIIDPLLFDGEEIVNTYRLYLDFVCITSERLIFVDVKGTHKDYVYVFFKHIQEVRVESGLVTGEVKVSTSKSEYELKLHDKQMAQSFAKQLMNSMRTV